MITRLNLRNFRSIKSASIEFSPLTILVGRNGSGKSNIADALSFLINITEWPLQTVFNRRGGPTSVARKKPRLSLGPGNSEPIEFGIGIEFQDVAGFNAEFDQETVNGRFSFLVSIGGPGFTVVREQCLIFHENGNREWFDRNGSKIRSSVDFLNEGGLQFLQPDALALPFLASFPHFAAASQAMKSMAVYSIDPGKLREFQDPDPGKRLNSDGSNAASVLRELTNNPTQFRRMFQILSGVIPDLERVSPITIGRKQNLRFIQQLSPNEKVFFDAFNMSDGSLRAFGILLALHQNERPDLLFIEEPETSLHPAATATIIDMLRQESEKTQIIISTHSPDVLDLAQPDVATFRVVTWDKGETHIDAVSGAAKGSLQQHLASPGELFKMQILDAPPLFEEEDSIGIQRSLFEEVD